MLRQLAAVEAVGSSAVKVETVVASGDLDARQLLAALAGLDVEWKVEPMLRQLAVVTSTLPGLAFLAVARGLVVVVGSTPASSSAPSSPAWPCSAELAVEAVGVEPGWPARGGARHLLPRKRTSRAEAFGWSCGCAANRSA